MWTEVPKGKNKKPVNKDRFISKMFLRQASYCDGYLHQIDAFLGGDSVVLSEWKESTMYHY